MSVNLQRAFSYLSGSWCSLERDRTSPGHARSALASERPGRPQL